MIIYDNIIITVTPFSAHVNYGPQPRTTVDAITWRLSDAQIRRKLVAGLPLVLILSQYWRLTMSWHEQHSQYHG